MQVFLRLAINFQHQKLVVRCKKLRNWPLWSFRALSLEAPPYAKLIFFVLHIKLLSLEPSAKTFAFGTFWNFQTQSSKASHILGINVFTFGREFLVQKVCDQIVFDLS
jgi:hypothetical protein